MSTGDSSEFLLGQLFFGNQRIHTYNDEHFKRLREKHNVGNAFMSDYDAFEGGGKGGTQLYKTRDNRFIIKQISNDDHRALLQCGESYVKHIFSEQSVLAPIYVHFEVSGNRFVAMLAVIEEGLWDRVYDLKGCADDKELVFESKPLKPVHKRWFMMHMKCECFWSQDRVLYSEGKRRAKALHVNLRPEDRQRVVQSIKNDVNWLQSHNLMDYSMLVGIRSNNSSPPAPESAKSAFEFTFEGESGPMLMSLGIIDFLQPWNTSKEVAQCVKFLETNKATVPAKIYGDRFVEHFCDHVF